MAIDLYQDQIAALSKLHTGSILRGGVGSGKTRTALAYYYIKVCDGRLKINGFGTTKSMRKNVPLYVITTAKTRDDGGWEHEAIPFYGVNPIVDSWNNIKKYEHVKNAFFVFDEQRVVTYSTWSKAFIQIARHNSWIMLSATPGDTWIDYAPVFIANGYYRNITDFRRQHVVYSRYTKYPKIEKYINTEKLERARKRTLVELNDNRKTVIHNIDVFVDYDKASFDICDLRRWNSEKEEPIRNASELCYLLRKIVNSDERRLEAVETILEEHCKAIVFYNFNYELEALIGLLESLDYPFTQWNGHKHESILSEDRWVYLVQYSAGAEGWNCTTTDTVIFYSQNYSYKLMEQASGRINRMNTPYTDLYYYHLISQSRIDKGIRKALNNKKRFNEVSFYNQ